MDQRSRRIPHEYHPGSPGETKDSNRSPNSETGPGTDLNHKGAGHACLDIGPAIRILQVNIKSITAAKREILPTICSKHKIDSICLQEVHSEADISRDRLVIDNYDLLTLAGNQQHGRAINVRSDTADAELLESTSLFDTILDLTYLTLRALLGFERWQSANKRLQLGSVKDHLGSIDDVDASSVEVVRD